MVMTKAKCGRCGVACDAKLCPYCTKDKERFLRAKEEREQKKKLGLCCPSCGCEEMPVYYTRKQFGKVKRVRKCRNCERTATTWEAQTPAAEDI